MRRLLLLLIVVPLLTVIGFTFWLTMTESGLRWGYHRALPFLPGQLTVNYMQGRLLGSMHFEGLEYHQPDFAASAEDLIIDWHPENLLAFNMDIVRIYVRSLEVVTTSTAPTASDRSLSTAQPDIKLPFEIQLQTLEIDGFKVLHDDQLNVINQIHLSASALQDQITIHSFSINSDDYQFAIDGTIRPNQTFDHDLVFAWQAMLPSKTTIDGKGRLAGNTTSTRLSQHISGPLQLVADAELHQLLDQFNWQADIDVADIDSTRLDTSLPPLTGKLKLRAKGDLKTAVLDGAMQVRHQSTGSVDAVFELQYLDSQAVQINRLQLKPTGTDTQLNLHGKWQPGSNGGDINIDLSWTNLRWPLTGEGQVNSASGSASVQGNIDQYRVSLADVEGPWPERATSTWNASAEGNLNGMTFNSLRVQTLEGIVSATGKVGWSPLLSWQTEISASDINPAGLLKDWPGQLSARFSSIGQFENDALVIKNDIFQLSGLLRGYPLTLKSRIDWIDNGVDIADFELLSGGSVVEIKGRVGKHLDLNWKLSASNLTELYPAAEGSLKAEGLVTGQSSSPIVEASIQGADFALNEYRIESIDGDFSIDLIDRENMKVNLSSRGLKMKHETIQTLDVIADSQHLKASMVSDMVTARIELKGRFEEANWRGFIEAIDINTRDFDTWSLTKPAHFEVTDNTVSADSLCWLSNTKAEACTTIRQLDNDWFVDLQLGNLSATLFKPWLPAELSLDSQFNAAVALQLHAFEQLTGKVNIDSPSGVVSYAPTNTTPYQWRYQRGSINLIIDNKGLAANTSIGIEDNGHLSSQITLPGVNLLAFDLKQQPVSAILDLALPNLDLIKVPAAQVSGLNGELGIKLNVNGTLDHPLLTGRVRLSNGAIQLTGLPQRIDQIEIRADTDEGGSLNFKLGAQYAPGTLTAHGRTLLDSNSNWETSINIDANQFELAGLLSHWLPEHLTIAGLIGAKAELQFTAPEQLYGSAHIELLPGTMSYPIMESETNEWQYHNGRVDINLTKQGLKTNAALTVGDDGQIDIALFLPEVTPSRLDIKTQRLEGDVNLSIQDIGIVEAMVPEIYNLKGQIAMNLGIGGTISEPRLTGTTQLLNASVAIPRLGLTISQLKIEGRSEGFEQLNFDLSAKSGDGTLIINGQTVLDANSGWPTAIHISGEDVEVSRIPEAAVLVSPDLNINLKHHDIDISGAVHIPYARLEPKDISTAARTSDDAVIIGRELAPTQKWLNHTKIRLTLGERVNFFGFGFDGRLGGSLSLEDEPGQLTRATGEINIPEGRYRAYGQRLDVEKGRLLYTGGLLTNPGLDIRAVRKVNNVIAGLQVQGNLNQPDVKLFTIPAMGQTDSLSYLLLGHPIENASGEEGAAMAKAALALGLSGGDRLARNLRDRFGLDEMRVESNNTGDQASLVVGRYLSPRLYVSYGVGLVEAFNTLSLRYKISDHWQLKTESGEHQGGDLLYTIER